MEGPREEAEWREGASGRIWAIRPSRPWVTDMMTRVPFPLDSFRAFPGSSFSASSSHVYPPSSWLDLDSAVFIYPLPHQRFPLHLAPSPICNLPHTAIAVAHIHSPLLSLRFLTQERHYSPNLIIMISPPVFYPLPFPLDPCVCDMAIREQTGTALLFFVTLLPSLFRNHVYPSGLFSSLLFAFGESSAQT